MKDFKHIISTTGLFGFVYGARIAIDLVRNKLAALLLGTSGMGLNSIFNESRELIHTTTNFGMDASGVRGISQAYEEFEQAKGRIPRAQAFDELIRQVCYLRSWVLLLSLLGAIATLVVAPLLSYLCFGSTSHTGNFLLLAPAVMFSTLSCGEMTVLKGMRETKLLAAVSLFDVLAGLAISLPIYLIWRQEGIVPALVLFSIASYIIPACGSFRIVKPKYSFSKVVIKAAMPVIVLGISFAAVGFAIHGVEMAIRAFLNRTDGEEIVGIYNAGYVITMSFASIVFAAIEADFFPRLSGIADNVERRTEAICEQAQAGLMLMAPILLAGMIALPVIVPLLLSNEFNAAVPMAQIAIIGLLFRAIYLPQAYLPLAAGHSVVFFLVNAIGACCSLLVIPGYIYGGLIGAGIALAAAHLGDLLIISICLRIKYKSSLPLALYADLAEYIVLVAAGYATTLYLSGLTYWLAGIGVIAACTLLSYLKYRKYR